MSLMFLNAKAQLPVDDGWFEIGNASYSSQILSMSFCTPLIGYAVGSGGACLKTTDGGDTWMAIDLGLNYDLNEIVFLSSQVGYMRGNYSNLEYICWKTTDGGNSWVPVLTNTGSSSPLHSMSFINDSVGFISSYEKYYKTTDYGVNWSVVTTTNFYDIWEIEFINQDTGFVLPNNGSIGVQRTQDAGVNWTGVLGEFALSMDFPSPQMGYVTKASSSGIFRTPNAGNTWENAYTGINFTVEDVSFINDSTGFTWGLYSNYGNIYMTSNYGDAWSLVYANTLANINGVENSPSGRLFAYGVGGLILSSVDGLAWDTVNVSKVKGTMNQIYFTDDQTGYIIGENATVLKTTDAAVNWVSVSSPFVGNIKEMSFVNDSTVYVAGSNYQLYKSTNGMNTWQLRNFGWLNGVDPYSLVMLNEMNGYLSASSVFYKTVDGGMNWTQIPVSNLPYRLKCLSQDTLLAGFFNGFMSSYDAGVTWAENFTGPSVFALHFSDATHGVIGDSWGRVRKTVDGGVSFVQKFNCGSRINDMVFISDSVGYFVAHDGFMGKTTDGGENWFLVESGTCRDLKSICFSPDGTGYVTGEDGVVLRKAIIPTYNLVFDVRDEYGVPLIDAVIELNGVQYPAGVDSIQGLIAGSYEYIISRIDLKSDTGTVVLTSDTLIPIQLMQYREVAFAVRNVFNDAVVMAEVDLGIYGIHYTDASGNVVYEYFVSADDFPVSVSATGYLLYSDVFDIDSDELFTIEMIADLDPPVASNATNIEDLSFTANWSSVSNADSYLLYVSDDPSFSGYVIGYDGLSVSGTSTGVTGLVFGTTYYFVLEAVNLYGISQESNVISVTTTAATDEFGLNDCVVYPNPGNGNIILSSGNDKIHSVMVTDVSGKVVYSKQFDIALDGEFQLQLQNLSNGMYDISILTEKSRIIVTYVKQ